MEVNITYLDYNDFTGRLTPDLPANSDLFDNWLKWAEPYMLGQHFPERLVALMYDTQERPDDLRGFTRGFLMRVRPALYAAYQDGKNSAGAGELSGTLEPSVGGSPLATANGLISMYNSCVADANTYVAGYAPDGWELSYMPLHTKSILL